MKNIIQFPKMFALLLLFCVLSENINASPVSEEKCSLDNTNCLKREAQARLPTFVQGSEELGIKPLDKMLMDDLKVTLPDIRYEMLNTEIIGFNNTIIDDISVYLPFKLIRLDFHTNLSSNYDYVLEGIFFGVNLTGKGNGKTVMNNLQMEMVIMFDIEKNEQGKDVMNLKNYFYGADALDGVTNRLENLFNGNKEKSDAFHEIINTNWRTVVSNFGRFFTAKVVKHIFEAIQAYMSSKPLQELANY